MASIYDRVTVIEQGGKYLDENGVLVAVQRAAIGAATSGNNTLLAALTGKIRVLSMALVAGASGNIYFTSGEGGTIIFGDSTNKIQLAANGGFVLPFNKDGWFETAAAQLLNMNASSTGPFSGGFTYVEIASPSAVQQGWLV